MSALIEIENVKKTYYLGKIAVPALRGINLSIEKGELLSIIGPSGSGKTTLMNIIGLIDKSTDGTVRIAGEDIGQMPDQVLTDLRLNKLGFIFQTFNLVPVLNALENVEFPLQLQRSAGKKNAAGKAAQLLEQVGLKDYMLHRPAELSGGQRQRVAIARALITDPDIVLADEPTANLDSVTGKSILELMKEMNRSLGTTFIFSTHNRDVLEYARRIVTLKDGLLAA
ncbi:MAG TPA: lipoprotein-releasing system ATP-binding protein LolD [Spirochaetia bacterium]|nr:lipoprotein-releasing system ATP-binding protein LolD [Spirochaetia bacterium]